MGYLQRRKDAMQKGMYRAKEIEDTLEPETAHIINEINTLLAEKNEIDKIIYSQYLILCIVSDERIFKTKKDQKGCLKSLARSI